MSGKKHIALILSIVLAAAAIAGVVSGSRSILKAADDVSFSLYDSFGDPAAAEGLKVEYTKMTANRLGWNATVVFGADGADCGAKSEYFNQTEQQYEAACEFSVYADPESTLQFYDFESPVVASLQPGESAVRDFRLKDVVSVIYPRVQWHVNGYNGHLESGDDSSLYGKFSELFRLEVPDELWVRLKVEKISESSSSGQTSFYLNGDPKTMIDDPYISMKSIYRDGNFYLMVNVPSYYRTSLKNGIWRVPFGKLDEPEFISSQRIEYAPLVDKAELVYETKDGEMIYSAGEFDSGRAMAVWSSDGDSATGRVTVLRYSDGFTQGFSVDMQNELRHLEFRPSDSCMAVYSPSKALYCIYPEGERYAMETFPADSIDPQIRMRIEGVIQYVAFEKGRAAVISRNYEYPAERKDDVNHMAYNDGFCLAVFTADGLKYYTRLSSSIMGADVYWLGDDYTSTWQDAEITKAAW